MFSWFDDITNWFASLFAQLETGINQAAADVDIILQSVIRIEDEILTLIQICKYYIIGASIAIAIILFISFVQLSRMNRIQNELAEIKELLAAAPEVKE